MSGDKICVNGTLVEPANVGQSIDALLSGNFIYQKIHTLGHKVLYRDLHIEIADASYTALYGRDAALSQEMLDRDIALLLRENRYPTGSNLVVLYLLPPKDEGEPPIRLLSCEEQMLYKGYVLWHKSFDTLITPYEYPFPLHSTAVSLACHTYAQRYARRKGMDAAVTENYSGILTGMGEHPLFALRGNEVCTTAIDSGAADSVERRIGIAACEAAGLLVLEQPIEKAQVKAFDEMFAVTPQGIISLRSCAGRTFPNTMARNIAARLAEKAATNPIVL